jgi:hypothetical protein
VNVPLELLRREVTSPIVVRDPGTGRGDDESGAERIRCPKCEWTPEASSRWSCVPVDHPEHFSDGCGAVWNTFTTRGCCPGCQHLWEWTSCLRCHAWSRHEDWYATD